ncbi:MAG: transporter, partial [Gammaproteobacteria bacterium]|nr:transporter [Gammaproteobacteria bacterium]
MPGIVELDKLLNSLEPTLSDTEYVFLSIKDGADYAHLEPLATFHEDEGLSLVVTRFNAEQAEIAFDSTFRLLTLKVHSSLEAVG